MARPLNIWVEKLNYLGRLAAVVAAFAGWFSGCSPKTEELAPAPVNEESPFETTREALEQTQVREAPRAWEGMSEVAMGELFACGLVDAKVYCWGSGRFGELGLGAADDRTQAVVPQGPLEGLGEVRTIAANRGFVCAVENTGVASCWGNNVHGQLGDGTTDNRYTPVRVQGLTSSLSISPGYQHACAVHQDGGVSCWGENADGQLGRPGGGMHLRPERVSGLGSVLKVASGRATTCALALGGRVLCWGSNATGSLGRGVDDATLEGASTPGAVQGVQGATDVSGFSDYFCAIDGRKSVWCWGDERMPSARALAQRERQIEAGREVDPLPEIGTPKRIEGIEGAVELAVGPSYACARLESGHVYCWGDNQYAQLGSGSQGEHSDPTPMASVLVAERIFAGARNTCVRTADRLMLCSGANRNGEIGNGGTATALTPAAVMRPATL